MAEKLHKIGIMGGTFDPVHLGHLLLAQTALCREGLEKVLFMPSPDPYYRTDKKVTPIEKRLDMLKIAVEDNPFFEVSDFEILLSLKTGKSAYTAYTLEEFKKVNPDAEVYFILGGDSLFSIENWKFPEIIFENAVILSSKRIGQSRGASGSCAPSLSSGGTPDEEFESQVLYLREKYGARVIDVHFPCVEISSTKIIEDIKNGIDIRYFVPDGVRNYILEKGLYK